VGTISAEVVEKADKEYSGTGFGWELTADGFIVYKISNKQQSNVFAVNDSGATLAGWVIDSTTLKSANGAVVLDSDDRN
jgi:hypothetical protein